MAINLVHLVCYVLAGLVLFGTVHAIYQSCHPKYNVLAEESFEKKSLLLMRNADWTNASLAAHITSLIDDLQKMSQRNLSFGEVSTKLAAQIIAHKTALEHVHISRIARVLLEKSWSADEIGVVTLACMHASAPRQVTF
jgi:hypothetical protein